ncbi:hypothetical protein ABTQ08_22220, partial [Acinetobacter baumannii]
MDLCPRALAVLKRQFALRERLIDEGVIKHDLVFCKADGEPVGCVKHVYGRWGATIDRLNIR